MSKAASIRSRKKKAVYKKAMFTAAFTVYMTKARICAIASTPIPKYPKGGMMIGETILQPEEIKTLSKDELRLQKQIAILEEVMDAATKISDAFREVGKYKSNSKFSINH